MIEHAAEHGLTADIFRVGRFVRVFVPERDKVVDSLVRPLPVVMGLNAAQNMTEVMFSQGRPFLCGEGGSPFFFKILATPVAESRGIPAIDAPRESLPIRQSVRF